LPLPGTTDRSLTPGSHLANCNIACLEPDAFDFPGASNVTTVHIQSNSFRDLPAELLWGMPSLFVLNAQFNIRLATLPEQFFSRQSNLYTLSFTGSTNFGSQERLPDGLFRGLTGLRYLDLQDCRYQNLPNMDDLKVCGHAAVHAVSWLSPLSGMARGAAGLGAEGARRHQIACLCMHWVRCVRRLLALN